MGCIERTQFEPRALDVDAQGMLGDREPRGHLRATVPNRQKGHRICFTRGQRWRIVGLAVRLKFQRLFVEVIGNQNKIAAMLQREFGPCLILTAVIDREQCELPVRATDRDGIPLIADTVLR